MYVQLALNFKINLLVSRGKQGKWTEEDRNLVEIEPEECKEPPSKRFRRLSSNISDGAYCFCTHLLLDWMLKYRSIHVHVYMLVDTIMVPNFLATVSIIVFASHFLLTLNSCQKHNTTGCHQ